MSQLHLDRLHKRPLSWSSISSWEYNKEKWATKYLDNVVEPPNKAMAFGKIVGEKLASDPKFLPKVPRLPIYEHGINYTFAGIPLVGFLDGYDPDPKAPKMVEYKTSGNDKRWLQATAESHGQLDMYAMLLFMSEKIKPESLSIQLVYIPVTEEGNFELSLSKAPIKIFKVKKTMEDILTFAAYLKKTYAEMESYAQAYVETVLAK